MLDFNTFESCLTELKEIHEKNMQLADLLGAFTIDLNSGLESCLLELLTKLTNDNEDWIGWWLYEDVPKVVTLKNGSDIDLSTPIALYNFLAMERNNG